MFTRLAKTLGPKGDYLAFCRSIRRVPFSVSVPIFGEVATIPEILNIHDNFAVGELRDALVEAEITRASAPIVVDCGVNVGVTVRWWLHLNSACRVFGFDMMAESHELTRKRLGPANGSYTGATVVLASTDGDPVTIHFSDPLDGMNRVGKPALGCRSQRVLATGRLDTLLAGHAPARIDLLKIDIEGDAAKALAGARHTLAVTRNVVVEAHSEDEVGAAELILVESGFRLRRFRSRNLWFQRPSDAPSRIEAISHA
jgi:FkbM family methyltransferase